MARRSSDKPIRLADDTGLPAELAPILTPIPEGQSGDFDLIHKVLPKGRRLQYFDTAVSWTYDRVFTVLRQQGDVWMSDTPQETAAMAVAARAAHGDVLVTGLGLGVFHRCLPKTVETCTTVESNDDVIHLVWPHLRKQDCRLALIQGDAAVILEQMRATGRTFDVIYLDTWDRGDTEYLPTMNWYVRLAQQLLRPKGEIRAWSYERIVKNFVWDCLELSKNLWPQHDTPEKREGLRARWPISAAFFAWWFDEQKSQATTAQIRTWAQRFARTVVAKPEHLFQLSETRVVRQKAKEIGLCR